MDNIRYYTIYVDGRWQLTSESYIKWLNDMLSLLAYHSRLSQNIIYPSAPTISVPIQTNLLRESLRSNHNEITQVGLLHRK